VLILIGSAGTCAACAAAGVGCVPGARESSSDEAPFGAEIGAALVEGGLVTAVEELIGVETDVVEDEEAEEAGAVEEGTADEGLEILAFEEEAGDEAGEDETVCSVVAERGEAAAAFPLLGNDPSPQRQEQAHEPSAWRVPFPEAIEPADPTAAAVGC
jgi:hypothetical protein